MDGDRRESPARLEVAASPPVSSTPSSLVTRLILTIGVLLFFAQLVPMARQPFWLDETATLWQVDGGFGELLQRTRAYPTNSLIHGAVTRLALSLPGPRELAARLPSFAAAALMLILCYRWCRSRIGECGAAAVVLVLLGQPEFLFAAVTARPYTPGLLMLVLSWSALMAWRTAGRRRHLAEWTVGAAGAVWLHPTFAIGIAAQLPLLVTSLATSRPKRRAEAAAFAALGACLLLPLLPQVADLARGGSWLGFVPPPDVGRVLDQLAPPGVALLALLLALSTRRPSAGDDPSPCERDLRTEALLLWLIPVAVAVVAAHGLGWQLFVSRYLLSSTLGLALLVGLIVARRGQRQAQAALIALALLVPIIGRPAHWPRLETSDWRAAALRIGSEVAGPDEVVLSISPFGESRSPELESALDPGGMLLSMYLAHPVPAIVIGLPSVCNAHAESRLNRLWAERGLDRQSRVLFLMRPGDRYADCLDRLAPNLRRRRLDRWGRLELMALERAPAPQ